MNLADTSILARLKISVWNGRIHDRIASRTISENYNADIGVGKLDKQLVRKSLLKRIHKAAGRTRSKFNDLTLPWLDDGERVIKTSSFNTMKQDIIKLKIEFDQEVENFIPKYIDFVDNEAEQYMGDLFNTIDYPTEDVVREKFGIFLLPRPLPSTGDWRIEDMELRSTMVDSLSNQLDKAKEMIREDLANRLEERLYAAISRLRADNIIRFRKNTIVGLKTTIDNITDDLNIIEDESIGAICTGLADTLKNVKEDWMIEELRQEPQTRLTLADKLDESYELLTGEKLSSGTVKKPISQVVQKEVMQEVMEEVQEEVVQEEVIQEAEEKVEQEAEQEAVREEIAQEEVAQEGQGFENLDYEDV